MDVNNPNDVGGYVVMASPFFEFPQAGGTAAVAEEAVGILGPGARGVAIGAIILHPTGALAISGASNVTVNVFKRTAGGSQTLIGTTTTNTGGTGWVAFTPVSLTLQTGAGSFVSPNDTITMQITINGTPTFPSFTIAGFVKPL